MLLKIILSDSIAPERVRAGRPTYFTGVKKCPTAGGQVNPPAVIIYYFKGLPR